MIEFWELIPPPCFPIYKFRIIYCCIALGCDIPILESLIFHMPFEQVEDSTAYRLQIDSIVLNIVRQLYHRGPDLSFHFSFVLRFGEYILRKLQYNHMQEKYLKLEKRNADQSFESKDDLSIVIEQNQIKLIGRRYYILPLSTFAEFAFHLSKHFDDWAQRLSNKVPNFNK